MLWQNWRKIDLLFISVCFQLKHVLIHHFYNYSGSGDTATLSKAYKNFFFFKCSGTISSQDRDMGYSSLDFWEHLQKRIIIWLPTHDPDWSLAAKLEHYVYICIKSQLISYQIKYFKKQPYSIFDVVSLIL